MVNLYKDGNKQLLIGVVEEPAREITKDGVKRAVMKLKDREANIITLWFANREGQNMADRVMKAGITKGSPLTVLAYVDEERGTANALQFKFKKSLWTFHTDRGDINVAFGTICKQREISENAVGVTVPVDIYDTETKESSTNFISVGFYDGDDEKRQFATRAKNRLFKKDDAGEYKHFTGAIVGGQIKDKEVNGRLYKNMPGWRVEVVNFE